MGSVGRVTRPAREVAAEVMFLLSCGESLDQIARTLGMQHQSIAKALRKSAAAELEAADMFGNRRKWLHENHPTRRRDIAA